MLSARILHTILPLIGYSQVSRGLCSNQFKGFNQVLIASSSLRKGLVDLFYPNAIEYVKESILSPGVCRMDLFRDFNDTSVYYIMEVHNSRDSFPNNIQSPHFQHFVSTCEDLLTQVSDLAEFKSLYPPKVRLDVLCFVVITSVGTSGELVCTTRGCRCSNPYLVNSSDKYCWFDGNMCRY